MGSIDYEYIFANLDTVLGLPLRRRGKRWTLPARINLESHSRKDKLVFYMNKSGSITVTEVILLTCLTFSCLIFPVAVVLLMLLGFCQARTVAG